MKKSKLLKSTRTEPHFLNSPIDYPTTAPKMTTENAAIRIIEDKVHEIETDRKHLANECELLRSENNWFRNKVADLEKYLVLTESKHSKLKKQQEDQDKLLNSMHQSLLEVTMDKRPEVREKNWYYEYTNEKIEKEYALDKVKQLEREKAKLEAELLDLKLKQDKVDASNRKRSLKHELKEMQQLENLKLELHSKEEKLKSTYGEHKAKLKSKYKEGFKLMQLKVHKYKRKIRHLEELNREGVARISELEKQVIETALRESSRGDGTHTEALENQLERAIEQNKILASRLDESSEHINNLNADMQNQVSQLESAWNEINELKSLTTRLNNKIQQLKNKKKLLKRDLEYKDNEVSKRNRFISNLVHPTLTQIMNPNGASSTPTQE